MARPAAKADCARMWEVEAARDGRLSGSVLDNARAHVERCSTCRAEAARLDALRAALCAVRPAPLDQLALRRLRQRVLERADAELAGRTVESGAAHRHARAARTGSGVLALGAIVAAIAATSGRPAGIVTDEPGVAPLPSVGPTLAVAPVRPRPAHSDPAPGAGASPKAPVAREATRAIAVQRRSPAHREAIRAEAAPPADATAQDTAYLHTLELLRQGHDDDARVAARDYLRQFPDGFRRKEMGTIAQ